MECQKKNPLAVSTFATDDIERIAKIYWLDGSVQAARSHQIEKLFIRMAYDDWNEYKFQ